MILLFFLREKSRKRKHRIMSGERNCNTFYCLNKLWQWLEFPPACTVVPFQALQWQSFKGWWLHSSSPTKGISVMWPNGAMGGLTVRWYGHEGKGKSWCKNVQENCATSRAVNNMPATQISMSSHWFPLFVVELKYNHDHVNFTRRERLSKECNMWKVFMSGVWKHKVGAWVTASSR